MRVQPTLNFATTAGLYSQLAGVLAGFAFVGLMTLVATQVSPRDATVQLREAAFRSFVPLLSAFIGLIATSLNYAVIASDSDPTRASLIETVAGAGFSISGVMLFLSILVALHSAQDGITLAETWVADAIRFVRRVIVYGIGPSVLALLYGGSRDNLDSRPGHSTFDYVDIVYLVAMLVVVAGSRFLRAPTGNTAGRLSAYSAAISLAAAVACTFIEAGVDAGQAGPRYLQVLLLLPLVAFLLANARECRRYV